jgi:hypothetical protein
MIGMTRMGVIELVLMQSLTFSLPAWIIGLSSAHFIVIKVLALLEEGSAINFIKQLSPTAATVATLLGLLTPAVAAVAPVRAAVRKNLHDTLDSARSKTTAVKFSIERASDSYVDGGLMFFGVGVTLFGFLIYYLLPLALVSFNLTLFFNLFFALLIGMLCGLVFLALNAEHFLELVVMSLFFYWERRAITSVVLKNHVAHKLRNRKTTIMFALSLSFILFIAVAYKVHHQ